MSMQVFIGFLTSATLLAGVFVWRFLKMARRASSIVVVFAVLSSGQVSSFLGSLPSSTSLHPCGHSNAGALAAPAGSNEPSSFLAKVDDNYQ